MSYTSYILPESSRLRAIAQQLWTNGFILCIIVNAEHIYSYTSIFNSINNLEDTTDSMHGEFDTLFY